MTWNQQRKSKKMGQRELKNYPPLNFLQL